VVLRPSNNKLALPLLLLVLALLLTAFYALTGLVYEEGAFGFDLVMKPGPGLGWWFGGGEEGIWAREHPGAPAPWWLTGDYMSLVHGDWEDGPVWWATVYGLGLLATFVVWLAFIATVAIALVRSRRAASAT
jgi:hypothetical protein